MRRWVLLRGLARASSHWGSFPQALAQATGDRVLALDLPGNGSRWRERSPGNVPALVDDLRARLPASDEPPVLLALSMGAMVAIEWARRHPDELAGCVLLNTSSGGASPFWHRLRPRQYATVARLLWPGTRAAVREAAVLRMTTSPRQPHAGMVERWAALADAEPVSPANAARQLWAAARYQVPDVRPGVPLLLLSSQGDALVHPECSRRLARRWQVPHAEHAWAGHDLPLDDPTWTLAQVAPWASSLPA